MSSYNGRKRMRLLDTDCCTNSAVYSDVGTDGSCGLLSWGTSTGIASSPLIPSSSSSPQRPKKRVRFTTPLEHDDEEEQVRTSPSINGVDTTAATSVSTRSPLTSTKLESSSTVEKEEEQQEELIFDPRQRRKELWWTKEERSQILDECRTIGREYKETHSDAVQDYLDLYEDECCNGTLPSIHHDADDDEDCMLATPLFPTHVRGLEWCVVPSTRSHRKVHVHDILDKQAELQRVGRDMRSMILSRRSIQSSKASRLLAHYTGQMDAISAMSDKC